MNHRHRIRTSAGSSGGANWLTTFNDLVTLLMVFFVLLFAMSSVDKGKMAHFQNSLRSGLGILDAGQALPVAVFDNRRPAGTDLPDPESSKAGEDETGQETGTDPVRAAARRLDDIAGLQVVQEAQTLRIRMGDGLLFRFGSAAIDPAGKPILGRVAREIGLLAGAVRVEGHTDDVPIHTARFPSNWELSTARAVNVVKFLISTGLVPPHRLSAVGYGDERPLGDNRARKGRAGNRRVEIVLEPTEERQNV